jgi:hypothetical protein
LHCFGVRHFTIIMVIGVQHDTLTRYDFEFTSINSIFIQHPSSNTVSSNSQPRRHPGSYIKRTAVRELGIIPNASNAQMRAMQPRISYIHTHFFPAATSSNALKTGTAHPSSFPFWKLVILPNTYLLTTFGSLLSGLPIPTPTRHHLVPPSCC